MDLNNEEKVTLAKLEEMRFQYQTIENNHSRLINKCSLGMVGICAILSYIVGLQQKNDSLFQLSNILLTIAIILLVISLCFLFTTLTSYKQHFISHKQVEQDSSSYLSVIKKINISYSKILTKMVNEVTKSHKNYKISLIFFIISTMLICLRFFQPFLHKLF